MPYVLLRYSSLSAFHSQGRVQLRETLQDHFGRIPAVLLHLDLGSALSASHAVIGSNPLRLNLLAGVSKSDLSHCEHDSVCPYIAGRIFFIFVATILHSPMEMTTKEKKIISCSVLYC
jgi:hypothetical protein